MKKLLSVVILLASAIVDPVPATAEVNVNIGIGIPLPPAIVFHTAPDVVVLPDTDSVYVAPDLEVDLFFWNGWWWRPWEGRWYRSRYYNRGWAYYSRVPAFYFDVDPGWRRYYRDHDWYGHRWNYERIPNRRLQRHWRTWHSDRHWERRGTWGVQGYQPRPEHQRMDLRRQREEQYQRRPEVRRHQQWMQEHQRGPGGRPHQRKHRREDMRP
jgi:hypothetical protein